MLEKQTKISDFSGVIYTTSKNELKMMWLSRITEVLDCFPPPSPQKWEAHACSKGSSYSVLGLGYFPENQPC